MSAKSTVTQYEIRTYVCKGDTMNLHDVTTLYVKADKDRHVQRFVDQCLARGAYPYVRVDEQRITREALDTTIIDLRPLVKRR